MSRDLQNSSTILRAAGAAMLCAMVSVMIGSAAASPQSTHLGNNIQGMVHLAARGDLDTFPFRDDQKPQDQAVVEKTQAALAKLGLYQGPVDGHLNNNLTAAIRNYQQQAGIKVDGRLTEKLLAHLERSVRMSILLRGLNASRQKAESAARDALRAHPATRDLIDDQYLEPADATRDPSTCFNSPTVRCLLGEAFESAKAVVKRDLRDWAMGEILTAQARAGLMDLAMETTRRIQDPRLIIVALKDIAAAQARAGREDDALAAAEIIPESRAQVQALAEIAETQQQHGYPQAARKTASLLLSMARHMKIPTDQVTFATKAAVTLYHTGDLAEADAALNLARSVADKHVHNSAKTTAWRQIADALAKLDRLDAALVLAKEVTRESDRAAVFIAATRAAIRAKNLDKAKELAVEIEAARYRALILGKIAVAKAKTGAIEEAEDIIDAAFDDAEAIALPFARSYAISRLVLALSDMARVPGGTTETLIERFKRAREAADGIKDARLRAQVLFEITAWQRRTGVPEDDIALTERQALEATEKITSAVSRVWIHGDAASKHARADEQNLAWQAFNRGIAEGRQIENPWARARSLTKLAQTLIDLVAPATAKAQELDDTEKPSNKEHISP